MNVLDFNITEERFARYDEMHGTPDPMIRRVASIRLPAGSAHFEQTDYGHPGRFNAWEPRGIDAKLQPRTEELRALCAMFQAFLGTSV